MTLKKIQALKKQIRNLEKKKILVLINEPFEKMVLGKNSNLAHILSCLDLTCDIYIHNFSAVSEIISTNLNPKISAIHLNKNQNLCDELIEKFKEMNRRIIAEKTEIINHEVAEILSTKNIKLADLKTDILLSEVEFVLQRLEPMKEPFPPQGKENLDKILEKIKNKFPKYFVFNCPFNLHDKEIPQEINRLLKIEKKAEISTPTAEFNFNDKTNCHMASALKLMVKKYHDLFPQKISAKIVLKPKNSAQSLGVFAIEFADEEVFDLEILKKSGVRNLQKDQIYKIKSNISDEDLAAMVKIFCFAQSLNSKGFTTDENDILIEKIADEEILKITKNLYDEVLVQPFLEGVRFGDVRANLAKDENNKFYLVGCVFRKNNRDKEGLNFTTGFTSGASTARPISDLTESEQNNLSQKIFEILRLLNEPPLQKKYQNSTELGLDFILSGDSKNIFLGEINHNCPGLLPVTEVIQKLTNEENYYDGGLALTKRSILQMMLLQENHAERMVAEEGIEPPTRGL